MHTSNFASKTSTLHQPNANLRTLKHTFDSLIAPTSPYIPSSSSDVDVDRPSRSEAWSTFLLSLELEHEELQNALLYLAQLIACNTPSQAEMERQGAGMLSGSPPQVFSWGDLVQGDCIERMSSMVLRSGILQGVIRLEELIARAEVEGEREKTEGVGIESMGEDRGNGHENMTSLEPKRCEQPCRPSQWACGGAFDCLRVCDPTGQNC